MLGSFPIHPERASYPWAYTKRSSDKLPPFVEFKGLTTALFFVN